MAVNGENERLYALMNGQPAAAGTDAQAAAALAAAEQAAADADYSHTADGRLDRAISDYLTKSGFIYDLSNDNNYKEFAQAYSQNALRWREAAQETANMLSGGYTPTYAAAVGSEVQGDIGANMANYAPTFRALGRQEQAARVAQAGNAAQLYQSMADTGYQRGRDLQGDKMNYLGYLADRYQGERQAALQRQDMANDVWRSRRGALTMRGTSTTRRVRRAVRSWRRTRRNLNRKWRINAPRTRIMCAWRRQRKPRSSRKRRRRQPPSRWRQTRKRMRRTPTRS